MIEQLLEEIRSDLMSLRTDLMLINHDITAIRTQLDRLESMSVPEQESIGFAPNTPPPTFIPPEYL